VEELRDCSDEAVSDKTVSDETVSGKAVSERLFVGADGGWRLLTAILLTGS
jgi:hypothetical protein